MVIFALSFDEIAVQITQAQIYSWLKKGRFEKFLSEAHLHGVNAVVINVKEVTGWVNVKFEHPLVKKTRPFRWVIDPDRVNSMVRKHGLRVIYRVAVFKDMKLSKVLKVPAKGWVFPDSPKVWDYNIALIKTLSSSCPDEIQIDYVRWPDYTDYSGPIKYSVKQRHGFIISFLKTVRESVPSYISVSADLFGRTTLQKERLSDNIGQDIVEISRAVDYVCPMVYPSHYWGDMIKKPYHTVKVSLLTAEKIGVPPYKLKPYLQAFPWRVPSSMGLKNYIIAQLKAASEAGVAGVQFWLPRFGVLYSALDEFLGTMKVASADPVYLMILGKDFPETSPD